MTSEQEFILTFVIGAAGSMIISGILLAILWKCLRITLPTYIGMVFMYTVINGLIITYLVAAIEDITVLRWAVGSTTILLFAALVWICKATTKHQLSQSLNSNLEN